MLPHNSAAFVTNIAIQSSSQLLLVKSLSGRLVSTQVMSAVDHRNVTKVAIAREQSEGQGARVRRSIGRPELPNLDPFLLLDEFTVSKPAGFPE